MDAALTASVQLFDHNAQKALTASKPIPFDHFHFVIFCNIGMNEFDVV
jgi:hypothetical protein